MNKGEIKDKIKEWVESKYKGTYRFIKEKNLRSIITEEEYNVIKESTLFIDSPISLKVYCFINDINEQPICKVCDNAVKYNSTKREYSIYCSNECRYNDSKATTEKRRETNLKRYGSSNVLNSEVVNEKRKKILYEKHGVDNYFKSSEYKENRDKYRAPDRNKSKKSRYKNTYHKLKESYLENVKLLTPEEEFIGVGYNKKYKWLCNICDNEYYSWYMNGIIKQCPTCNKYTSIEKFVINLLNENNISYETNNRTILSGREIDVYIPEFKLGIETNGLFWHCDKVIKDKNYHLNKLDSALTEGINLINIFEDEIYNKPAIVKSRILSKVNKFQNIIYARKCDIRDIKSSEANIFYEKNHIQGRCNSSINIGLFFKDELVSALSFTKLRPALGHKSKPNTYELTRYCNKLNTKIIGGFTRGIKFLERNYDIKEIYSYCDRRWSEGEFYETCGFKFIKNTAPNYWYIPPNKVERCHRYNYRKNVLKDKLDIFNESLSETVNMRNNNFNIIWDCGNKLYIK